MNRNSLGRILAMDIRADRMGYAAFETPEHLSGYGTSRFNSGETGRARMEFLLEAFTPSILVLRRPRARSTRRRLDWTLSRKMMGREAKKFNVAVAFVAERAQKALFAEFNCRNKYEVAALLGRWFPEIARYVPQARKCYEPEPWMMAFFDAIAVGVTYRVVKGDVSHFPSEYDGVFSPASK